MFRHARPGGALPACLTIKQPSDARKVASPAARPGSYWEYNDVRINQFSLALLHLFKRPLPEVFLESVLKPIGGGRDFRWRATTMRGLRSTASAFSRFPAVRTGAAA